MPLGDLYQQDTDRALSTMASMPPAPPQREERSAWGAPWRALKAGAAEVAGSAADVFKGAAAAQAMTMEADPVARAAVGDRALQQGAAEGRRQIETGEALVSDVGQSFRSVAADLRPDPATASKAEQVVFGVVRPLAKLAAGGLVAGPFGLAGASVEEGFTQSEELRQQGVDLGTRAKIGALTAGANAAGAFLPLAGPTLKATAGLYLAGGPGAFMAQQYATRKILEHADYPLLAQQYDPLDPMGLALSALIPLPFAAHGALRNVRALRAEPAPRVEPTLEAGPAPAREPSMEPKQAAQEPNADNRLAAEPRPEQAGPAFADTEPAAHVPHEAVDAAMVHNLTALQDAHETVRPRDPYADLFAEMQPKYQVPEESQATLRPGDNGLPEIRTSRVMLTDAQPIDRFEAILEPGEQMVQFLIRSPEGKTLGYADLLLKDGQIAGLYDIEVSQALRGQGAAAKVVEAITSLAPDRRLEISNIVPEARGFWEKVGVDVNEGNPSSTLDWHQFAGSPAARDRGIPRARPAEGGADARPDARAAAGDQPAPPAAEAGEVSHEDFLAALEQLNRPAAVAGAEAAAPAPSSAGGAKELQRSITDRLAEVEKQHADLVVRTDENGKPVTVAQELAQVRREAAEGTDTELGTLDADLVKVAADCALSTGTA